MTRPKGRELKRSAQEYYNAALKKDTGNTILDVSVTQIKNSIGTKCVHFHVIHKCLKSYQPRGSNNKVMTNISLFQL